MICLFVLYCIVLYCDVYVYVCSGIKILNKIKPNRYIIH